ncbi:hypothetical protein HB892_14150 [Listeria welshimeri]|nr:hypothetical protein [Listeria welshimeri]
MVNKVYDGIYPVYAASILKWMRYEGVKITVQDTDFVCCIFRKDGRFYIRVLDLESGTSVMKYDLNVLDLKIIEDRGEGAKQLFEDSVIPELEKIILKEGRKKYIRSLEKKKIEMENRYGKKPHSKQQ